MRMRTVVAALTCLLLFGNVAVAQTGEIQKKVEKKLGELKKEQAKKDQNALEELLGQALKNNPDIRVAESKLHEAEAELYRARVKVFNRIVTLQQEVRGLKAELERARQHYLRMTALFKTGAVPNLKLDESSVALQKATNDSARAEADMDLLVGKHREGLPKWLAFSPDGRHLWSSENGNIVRLWDNRPIALLAAGPATVAPTPAPGTTADKIRKALEAPYDSGPKEIAITADELIQILRKHTKGINVVEKVNNLDEKAELAIKESIPLAALFQWAEDQFNWRFLIRDYGIVVTNGASVPPGAVLLLDFWHKGKAAAASK